MLALLLNCGTEADKKVIDAQAISKFKLASDFMSFKEKMEEGDTLVILADLSICTSWHYEENCIVKRDGRVFLTSMNEGEFVDTTEIKLSEAEYIECETDTLSFEAFFKYLGDKRKIKDEQRGARITITRRQDTIRYGTLGLIDAMKVVDYYTQIKRCLYPNVNLYQPVEIPQPKEEHPPPPVRANL